MAVLCAGGVKLRSQLDKYAPYRDKASDGWIGDKAHASRDSDHNPDEDEIVHATDFDEDFGAKGDCRRLADQLAELARAGKDDGRLKYLVYEDQVASGTYTVDSQGNDIFWRFRGHGYGHTQHLHTSYTDKANKNGSPWDIPLFRPKQWDGWIPDLIDIQKAAESPLDVRNKAVWRVACRLFDLGFYDRIPGTPKPDKPLPIYSQGYPRKAIIAFQKAQGWDGSGDYGPKTHLALFGK